MNKIPEDKQPIRIPRTIVYVEKGQASAIENLQHLPVTVQNWKEAHDILQLLYPGAHMLGLHSGHGKIKGWPSIGSKITK